MNFLFHVLLLSLVTKNYDDIDPFHSNKSRNLTPFIGPLHDPVTWNKITHAGEQVAQWDLQNNAPAFVLEVPLRNLLTSICNFAPCDQVVQRAYYIA